MCPAQRQLQTSPRDKCLPRAPTVFLVAATLHEQPTPQVLTIASSPGSRASPDHSPKGLAPASAEADSDRVHPRNPTTAAGKRAVVRQWVCLRVVELPSWLHQLYSSNEHGMSSSPHCLLLSAAVGHLHAFYTAYTVLGRAPVVPT